MHRHVEQCRGPAEAGRRGTRADRGRACCRRSGSPGPRNRGRRRRPKRVVPADGHRRIREPHLGEDDWADDEEGNADRRRDTRSGKGTRQLAREPQRGPPEHQMSDVRPRASSPRPQADGHAHAHRRCEEHPPSFQPTVLEASPDIRDLERQRDECRTPPAAGSAGFERAPSSSGIPGDVAQRCRGHL